MQQVLRKRTEMNGARFEIDQGCQTGTTRGERRSMSVRGRHVVSSLIQRGQGLFEKAEIGMRSTR